MSQLLSWRNLFISTFLLSTYTLSKSYYLLNCEKACLEEFYYSIISEKYRLWSAINLIFCALVVFGMLVQKVFFGKLRRNETQKISDCILKYLLFKLVLVMAIIEPENSKLLFWAVSFSILGLLRVFTTLCKDRFDYLINISAPIQQHSKVLFLIGFIFVFNMLWFTMYIFNAYNNTWDLLLLSYEFIFLFLNSTQIIVKYILNFIKKDTLWEERGTYISNLEFITESLLLLSTLAHYAHILSMHGLSFTVIDALVIFNMKVVFGTLKDKINSYRNLVKIKKELSSKFETVNREELEKLDDNCAICREKMETAKRLPCSHVFHKSCLLRWLEQYNVDHSCPTCRYSLNDILRPNYNNNNDQGANNQNSRSYFNAIQNYLGSNFQVTPEMVNTVHAVVPHVPVDVITEDLRLTHSVEFTLERIIEGLVHIPDNITPPHNGDDNGHYSQNIRSPSQSNIEVNHRAVDAVPEIPKPVFASNKEERQKQLNMRKQMLKEAARKNLISKQNTQNQFNDDDNNNNNNNDDNDSNSFVDFSSAINDEQKAEFIPPASEQIVENDAATRRRLMLEAAERRLRNSRSEELNY